MHVQGLAKEDFSFCFNRNVVRATMISAMFVLPYTIIFVFFNAVDLDMATRSAAIK